MINHDITPKSFVTDILKRIAPKINATLLIEPEYEYAGMITFQNGKKVFYRSTRFNINPLGASEIAKDKGYSSFFLKHFGYSTPEGNTFFNAELNEKVEIKRTIDDGYEYAKQIGFPVIIKPNNLSQGVLVTKVHNKDEYYKIAKKILKKASVMLVQKFYEGRDYRVVVLNDKVISAYQRIPLYIAGNGKSTIKDLLEIKQSEFEKLGRDTIIDTNDKRIILKLKHRKMSFNSVIPKNQTVYLLDNSNLSCGGEANDVTNLIHKDYIDLAVKITKDMNLRLCGVDIITKDITKEFSDYVIIEINSAPGLDNYASIGTDQQEVVENLYLEILKTLEKD